MTALDAPRTYASAPDGRGAEAAVPARELDAFYQDLVQSFYEPILRYVHSMTGSQQQAEDLVQDTFLKAYLALPRSGVPDNPRAWLYRIATNTTLDELRRRRKLAMVGLDKLAHVLSGRDRLRRVDDADPIQRAMAAIKPGDRSILSLFAGDGLKAPEVAAILGITPAAARKRRQRAREAFMAAYREVSGEV